MPVTRPSLKRLVREAKAHVNLREFFERGKFHGQSTQILRKVLGSTKQDRQNTSKKMSRKQRLGIAKTSLEWSRKIRAVKAAVEKYGFENGNKTPERLFEKVFGLKPLGRVDFKVIPEGILFKGGIENIYLIRGPSASLITGVYSNSDMKLPIKELQGAVFFAVNEAAVNEERLHATQETVQKFSPKWLGKYSNDYVRSVNFRPPRKKMTLKLAKKLTPVWLQNFANRHIRPELLAKMEVDGLENFDVKQFVNDYSVTHQEPAIAFVMQNILRKNPISKKAEKEIQKLRVSGKVIEQIEKNVAALQKAVQAGLPKKLVHVIGLRTDFMKLDTVLDEVVKHRKELGL